MTIIGRVKGGVIVVDGPIPLPEGTQGRVTTDAAPREEILTLYERLKPVIGAARNLPEDMAANHDHYIHGTPKK